MSQTQENQPCPFCGVSPIEHDGDLVVNHTSECFFTRQYAQEMWLIGRRIKQWNNRNAPVIPLEKEIINTNDTPLTDAQVAIENPIGVPGNTAKISTSFTRELELKLNRMRSTAPQSDRLRKAAEDVFIHLKERTHPEGKAMVASYEDFSVCSVRAFEALRSAISTPQQDNPLSESEVSK